tara:strand:- start:217 stop:1215 length:999 start_codon:yes stop_codon:yes gene_type:complete
MGKSYLSIQSFVEDRNQEKILFTPGPASLISENIEGLMPCFGREDESYLQIEKKVLESLSSMTGKKYITRLQGSASLGLEIMTLNFLRGNILLVSSGYYSDRLAQLVEFASKRMSEIKKVECVNWDELRSYKGDIDWIVACYTETSRGLLIPIDLLKDSANALGAKLMLDATASIGLEDGHDKADVIGFSSCKGLFGLTGACFIAYNSRAENNVDSFYLDIKTHENHMMTGPYHSICSLSRVLPIHEKIKESVKRNKELFMEKYRNYLTLPLENQPLLCTHISKLLKTKDKRVVLYSNRAAAKGSITCHLGEAHLKTHAKAEILNSLFINEE